jgi:hypothetical protein
MENLVIEVIQNRESLDAHLSIQKNEVKTWMGTINGISLKDVEWLVLNSGKVTFSTEIEDE